MFSLMLDVAYYSSERYGKGAGPVLMDYVNCTGSEGNLWRGCTHLTHYFGCSHSDDVGVQCQPGDFHWAFTTLTTTVPNIISRRWGELERSNWWRTIPRSTYMLRILYYVHPGFSGCAPCITHQCHRADG